mgnify:CR=1 FL=1
MPTTPSVEASAFSVASSLFRGWSNTLRHPACDREPASSRPRSLPGSFARNGRRQPWTPAAFIRTDRLPAGSREPGVPRLGRHPSPEQVPVVVRDLHDADAEPAEDVDPRQIRSEHVRRLEAEDQGRAYPPAPLSRSAAERAIRRAVAVPLGCGRHERGPDRLLEIGARADDRFVAVRPHAASAASAPPPAAEVPASERLPQPSIHRRRPAGAVDRDLRSRRRRGDRGTPQCPGRERTRAEDISLRFGAHRRGRGRKSQGYIGGSPRRMQRGAYDLIQEQSVGDHTALRPWPEMSRARQGSRRFRSDSRPRSRTYGGPCGNGSETS